MIKRIVSDLFTARNGVDYSLTKLLGVGAGVAMIYQFIRLDSTDYTGFGTGVGLLMGALAAKYWAEK